MFGQCLGKDRGQKGVPKWTNRWDFNHQNSGEMNHNWQGLTGSWIFWGACLPPLNPSVPSGIDSGTQAPLQRGSAVFSPRPPGFPGDSPQSTEASAACASAEGAGPFWLVYHLFVLKPHLPPLVSLCGQAQSLAVHHPGLCHKQPVEGLSRRVT